MCLSSLGGISLLNLSCLATAEGKLFDDRVAMWTDLLWPANAGIWRGVFTLK